MRHICLYIGVKIFSPYGLTRGSTRGPHVPKKFGRGRVLGSRRTLLEVSCAHLVAALGGRKRRKGTGRMGTWGLWRFLDPCDQNETYHPSREDKIEHMDETC